jgi:hypothetical protein
LIIFAFVARARRGGGRGCQYGVGRSWRPAGGPAAWQQLAEFRDGWYGCLRRWGDALSGLAGAVACAGGPVTWLPGLSLLPAFGRGHGSAYAALAKGRIDAGSLRDLLAAAGPPSWPLVFAVDGTSWPRCDAETSPRPGLLLSPVAAQRGQADRRGLVVPADQPAELREGLLDLAGGRLGSCGRGGPVRWRAAGRGRAGRRGSG